MAGNRPRVFHLITRLLKGGAEAKTIATIEGLDDYEFTLGFGAEYDPEQRAAVEALGVETVRFRSMRHYNPATAVVAVGAVARHLHRNDYDIVHTHSTEAGIVGRLAARIAGVPNVVHTVHGVPFASDRNSVLNRFVLACERTVAPWTDVIVTNADVISDEYLERGIGNAGQYQTVYSGIDVDRFSNAEPAGDLPGERPRIVMIGRMADGKGFDVLLEAIERLRDQDVSVILVGDGPIRDEIESDIDRRMLGDRVFALGFREDVPSILAASDLFVLPSFREGTPRVITEAMAAGLPIVATDIAGIPEQVAHGENGYLVPPGDATELADRIERLHGNDDRRSSFGTASRSRVSRFEEGKMVAELDSLYRKLIVESSRRF